MPPKNKTCGIYAIQTPSGSMYIGSSIHIERRFNEHKSMLRRGVHHSSRLQQAYNKHGNHLVFSVLCVCEECNLVEMEQHFIKHHNARLNVAQEVNNVWTNPETRRKITETNQRPEVKARRSQHAKNISTRWRTVECSDGTRYKNLTEAGKAFGVSASHILALIASGYRGTRKVKERFKFASEEWANEDIPHGERLRLARERNGKNKMSDEAKHKMRVAAKGRKPSQQALDSAAKASAIPVKGVSVTTSETVLYPSAMEAARNLNTGRVRTAASQINKCIKGVKKSAYGFIWSQV